jgi:2-polyprenyl-3-methyl-5-hydroxy-6-metoxy-1,4-benzoquinol methylase
MSGLAQRLQASELMDADDLDPAIYAAVVADLANVNAVTLAARPTLAFIARAAKGRERLKLLDVGFGDGDMLRRIARWAARRGLAIELAGVDLNPRSEAAARAHTPPELAIRWITGDYAALGDEPWDCVISSLVAHHMSHAELVAFLRWMSAHARVGWLINDLERHGFAHRGFPLLARVAGWHRIVRLDGTTSIARSYRPDEWPPLLAEAGVGTTRVYRAFPFRLCVEQLH